MTDTSTAKLIGTALIVSEDAVTTAACRGHARTCVIFEVCIKVSDALDRVNHSKLEVAVIDCSLGNQATLFLLQVRGSASNRTAGHVRNHGKQRRDRACAESRVKFCAGKTLTLDSIRYTLKAAYGLIVRERRRYFRYPVSVPAAASRKGNQKSPVGR